MKSTNPPEYKGVTLEEEQALFKRFHAGDTEAGDRLFEAFQRLAWGVAYRNHHQLPFEDVLFEAYIGLLDAMRKFDYHRGRFGTYARHRVRGWVLDYVARETQLQKVSTPIVGVKNSEETVMVPEELREYPKEFGDDENRDSLRQMVINRLLSEMGPLYRDVLLSFLESEATLPDLADKHGLSRTRLWDIRRKASQIFIQLLTTFAEQNPELAERAGILEYAEKGSLTPGRFFARLTANETEISET